MSHAALDVKLTYRVHPSLTLDVAFQLAREAGVVFGPSGAGKTTLLRLIAGLTTPEGGHVRLEDDRLFDSRARVNRPLRLRRIGMVFQDDLLFPHLSVASNIRFGLKGWPRVEAETRSRTVAALCDVGHLLERRPSTLSGGERQRVGLARALAPRPRLLLCDEPVSALDLANRHTLIDRLRAVQTVESIPVLYVTHSPAEAIALGSTLFLLEHGRIVAEGSPLVVLTSRPGASGPLEGVRNVFAGTVEAHRGEAGETRIRLVDGPVVIVPFLDRPEQTRVEVAILAEEVLLARDPIGGLSARNVIEGVVEQLHPHGSEAEVVVRTDGIGWIVSVVATAVEALGLQTGVGVHMIFKARSCHVRSVDEPGA